MRKLFTLLTVALFATSLWADPIIPSTTLTLPTTGLGEWTGVDYTNAYFNDGTNGYVIYSPYAIRISKANQTWYATTGTTGSATGSWNGTDIFKGAAYYAIYQAGETDMSKYRMDVFKKAKSDLYHYYRVTNCTGVKIYLKSSASSTASIKVYEVSGEPGSLVATEVTAAANSASYSSAAAQTLANKSTLSADKNYIIEVHGTEGNKANQPFYEIAFYYPLYTITLNPNGGSYATTPSGWVADGSNIKKTDATGALTIPEPTRANYDFNGWKSGTKDVVLTDGKLTVTQDSTLTAQWVDHVVSDDNEIKSLTIDGNSITPVETTYSYAVRNTDKATKVTVAYTINALATGSPTSPFDITIPAAGDPAATQTITVRAESGAEATYTASVTRAAASNNANLSALSVSGYTLSPAFASSTTSYTIEKAYKAKNPAKNLISATKEDDYAKSVVIDSLASSYTITVTAEDNTTTKVYTINVIEGDAPRAIKEIFMSNKYMAYIPDGDETNIYAYYLAGEDAATVDSVNRSEGATWAVNEGKLRVTGEDSKYSDYTLNISSVTPVEYTTSVIAFDSTNMNTVKAWVKAPYGFDMKKGGWKFSKTDGDFTREIAGKTHIEMFLPACDTIVIAAGAEGTVRDVKFYINGVQFGNKVTLAKNAGVTLAVKQSKAFMLTIASAQTGGDGGVGSIRMAKTIYTVTYNAGSNGTCATETAKVANGDAATLPAVTPNDGYRFDGWFTAASEGTKVGKAGEKITITKDTTLYAQYSEFGFYIAGIGGWEPDQLLVSGISHTFDTLTVGRSYAFKVTRDGTWGTGKGFSDLTPSEVIAGLYAGDNNNICFTLAEAGDVTITYDGELFKVEGIFEPQTIKIKGGWDGWAEHTATLSDDKKSASVTLALEIAENVEFGVLYNSDFRANGKTFVRDDNSATGITGNTGNMKLTSDKAGDYTFTWIFGTNALEITFPTGTTDLENVVEEGKAVKVLRNGQLFIEKNGRLFNAQGQLIK